jgi:hypothetical protein
LALQREGRTIIVLIEARYGLHGAKCDVDLAGKLRELFAEFGDFFM